MSIENEYSRIKWACRRGMLELDLILIPFFEKHFTSLSKEEKDTFIKMLDYPDPDIFNWLMEYTLPEQPEIAALVKMIRDANSVSN